MQTEQQIRDEARRELSSLTTQQVSLVSELDGDSRRRELARYELEARSASWFTDPSYLKAERNVARSERSIRRAV